MSEERTSWHPGEVVPESGIYECDCGAGHHWSTDVKGHRFPPGFVHFKQQRLPAGVGSSW
ncbi:hypothetical protein ACIBCU_24950 [Streptomyces sp. NPDC051064]|uniref:hypothetical protein n=1 Tax=Streptomyces sp. NPDC051064 TaxID=3365641 RepID=UPI00379A4B4E